MTQQMQSLQGDIAQQGSEITVTTRALRLGLSQLQWSLLHRLQFGIRQRSHRLRWSLPNTASARVHRALAHVGAEDKRLSVRRRSRPP
jgi:hypothetical protein